MFAIPAAAALLVASLVIIILPSIYTASATILVEGQEVPQELVQSTVTGYIEERLQSVSQRAFSRKNLLGVIERFGLYKEDRDILTSEEILEKMRENIIVENIQADVVSDTGRSTTATIAFSIAFDGKYPRQVLQTTNALVSLFLEENLRTREEKAHTTYDFLTRQLNQLREEVSATESKVAQFKEKHYRSLPEMMALNLQSLDRVQKDIDARQEMVKTLVDRKVYLEGQLATVDQTAYSYTAEGQRIMTPEEELKSLRSQYLSAKAIHSEKHPDVVKLTGQIALLEAELTARNTARDINAELESWRRKLTSLERQYTGQHPDVIKARSRVASLEKAQAQAEADNHQGMLKLDVDLDQENPAYINLKTQIEATTLEIRNERQMLVELRRKYDEYVGYIEHSPQVEQTYLQLQRDYQNSSQKYQETMQKVLAARQAQELEKEHVSEKFSLVEPPVLPEKPYKPRRAVLFVVAMVLSIGVGIGCILMAELLDSSVHDDGTLSGMIPAPVLGVIPYVQTAKEIRRQRRRKVFLVVASVGGVVMVTLLFHVFVLPIDILFFKIINKVQRIV
ncbi:chain-length determining protein [Pseudodesulfovibrio sediminis]|uniref:Chain-length determining protein n=1 Tax=Pseudodesulfovibrio sediminis TaxID=2810563 RepID=A0ABN6EV85_9BACT|nr:chain-length determining protein [Pseudodesulfovibrio sediminis]